MLSLTLLVLRLCSGSIVAMFCQHVMNVHLVCHMGSFRAREIFKQSTLLR